MVCAIDDFLGGDQGEIRMRGNKTSEGSENQSLVVWEDVSVCHCCERNGGRDRGKKRQRGNK